MPCLLGNRSQAASRNRLIHVLQSYVATKRAPGVAVCVCVFQFSQRRSPSGSAVRNHCRTHPAPCVRPRCVCSVCVHMHSFAGLIRRTPPPTFSDTAITDRHSDTTIFQLRAHWVRISWSIGSEKSFGHVHPVGVEPGVEPSTPCMQGEHPIH